MTVLESEQVNRRTTEKNCCGAGANPGRDGSAAVTDGEALCRPSAMQRVVNIDDCRTLSCVAQVWLGSRDASSTTEEYPTVCDRDTHQI